MTSPPASQPPAFPPALGSPVSAPKHLSTCRRHCRRDPGGRRASLAAARKCRLKDPQEPALTCFTDAVLIMWRGLHRSRVTCLRIIIETLLV
jgi:hypothetical protein